MTKFDQMSDSAFIRLPQVLELLSVSKSTLYRMMDHGDFPRSRKLSSRTVAWQVSEIRAWIENNQKLAEAA